MSQRVAVLWLNRATGVTNRAIFRWQLVEENGPSADTDAMVLSLRGKACLKKGS